MLLSTETSDDDDDEDIVDPKKDPDDSGGEETGNNVLEEPVIRQSLTGDSSDSTDLDTAGTEDDIAGRNGAKMKKKKEPVTPRNGAGAKDIDSEGDDDGEDERENGNNSRSTKTRNRMKSEEEEVEDNEVLCDGEEEAEHQLKEDGMKPAYGTFLHLYYVSHLGVCVHVQKRDSECVCVCFVVCVDGRYIVEFVLWAF